MPQMPPYVTVHIVYQERNMQVLMAESSLLEKVHFAVVQSSLRLGLHVKISTASARS